jgi:hypothetical protein
MRITLRQISERQDVRLMNYLIILFNSTSSYYRFWIGFCYNTVSVTRGLKEQFYSTVWCPCYQDLPVFFRLLRRQQWSRLISVFQWSCVTSTIRTWSSDHRPAVWLATSTTITGSKQSQGTTCSGGCSSWWWRCCRGSPGYKGRPPGQAWQTISAEVGTTGLPTNADLAGSIVHSLGSKST